MKNIVVIAAHKECRLPTEGIYLPVHVGASAARQKLDYVGDDTGENISSLNPVFCELTGLYWAWKNLDYDYLGLVQYRRFFRGLHRGGDVFSSVLTGSEMTSLLGKYKIIVPHKRHYYIETIYSHYAHTFDGSQLDTARQIIAENCPEYIPDFDALMTRRSAYVFNMMIMPRGLMEEYCTWLFDILFVLYERIDSSEMTPFEKRYAGRISERLFNVWLDYKLRTGEIRKSDIKELPVIYAGKVNWWKKGAGFLKAKFLKKKYQESF